MTRKYSVVSEECPVCGGGPVTARRVAADGAFPGWTLGEDLYRMECGSCRCDFWYECDILQEDTLGRLEEKVARALAKKLMRGL